MSADDIASLFAGVEMSAWNDVDVTFTNARFVQNPQYVDSDGNMPIVLSVDLTNEDGNQREDQLFSLGGQNFELANGGAEIVATNPKLEKTGGFATGTKLQVLLNSLLSADADAVADHFEKVGVGPRHAAFWENLCFHLVEVEVPNRRNPEKPYKQQTATSIISWGEAKAAKAPAKAAAKPRPTKPVRTTTKAAAVAAADFNLSDDDFEAVSAIATAAGSFEDFQNELYDNDIIVNDGVQEVADDDTATGLYARLTA